MEEERGLRTGEHVQLKPEGGAGGRRWRPLDIDLSVWHGLRASRRLRRADSR